MKRSLLTLLLCCAMAATSVTGCTAVQRAHVAAVVDRAAPALRTALRAIVVFLGFLPASAETATARVLAGATGALVDLYEQSRDATAGCRAWIVLHGTLTQSVTAMDHLDADTTVRTTAKQATALTLAAMPPSCREAELALIAAETPGTVELSLDGGTRLPPPSGAPGGTLDPLDGDAGAADASDSDAPSSP